MPTFWLAVGAYFLFFFVLQLGAGVRAAGPGDHPAADRDRVLHRRRAARRPVRCSSTRSRTCCCPGCVLILYTVGLLVRFSRSAILDVLGQDYVRAARAKGLPPGQVVFRYVLRGALLPILTSSASPSGRCCPAPCSPSRCSPGAASASTRSVGDRPRPARRAWAWASSSASSTSGSTSWSTSSTGSSTRGCVSDDRRRARAAPPAPSRCPPAWRRPLAVVGAAVIIALGADRRARAGAPHPGSAGADRHAVLTAPSAAHWFGTDELGRDVLSRTLWGSQVSLPLAVVLVVASLVIGSVLGAVAGYVGGAVDEVIMRIADLVFAFPTIILAMVVAAALGPSLTNAVVALMFVNWPNYARVMRSLVLGARGQEYVIAGRLLGAGPFTSLGRDVLPNVAAPMLRARRPSTSATRSCCCPGSRSSASAPCRRPRSGGRWSPTGCSSSRAGGSPRSPGSRSSRWSWRSTSSATRCATRSTPAPRAPCRGRPVRRARGSRTSDARRIGRSEVLRGIDLEAPGGRDHRARGGVGVGQDDDRPRRDRAAAGRLAGVGGTHRVRRRADGVPNLLELRRGR